MIDWKKNNKIALRNFSEAVDFHDIVKALLVRLLRRNYPDSSKYPIYTEFNSVEPNQSYPDIWMKVKNDIYVWEIQEQITAKWKEQITKKYEDLNLIIVNLKDFKKQINDKIIKYNTFHTIQLDEVIDILKEELDIYVI